MREVVAIEKVSRRSRCFMFNEPWGKWEKYEDKTFEELLEETLTESASPNDYGEYIVVRDYYLKETGKFLGSGVPTFVRKGKVITEL